MSTHVEVPALGKVLSPVKAIADDLGKLVLRVGFGAMMALGHGLGKAQNFEGTAGFLEGKLGLSGTVNAYLVVGAELVCATLVALGLLTRLSTLPLLFAMGFAAFVHHAGDPMFAMEGAKKEPAVIYLLGFAAVLLVGPGRLSLDQLLFGLFRRRKTD